MIRWLMPLLIGAVTLSMSGCFYLGGDFETHVTPVSERLSTMSEVIPVPGSDVVTVDANLSGSMLAIEAHLNPAAEASCGRFFRRRGFEAVHRGRYLASEQRLEWSLHRADALSGDRFKKLIFVKSALYEWFPLKVWDPVSKCMRKKLLLESLQRQFLRDFYF